MKRIHLLPNLLTLANAFCGLLAVAKAIDALAYAGTDPLVFYRKLESACVLVFAGMVFDVLDGFAARLTRSESAFGVQLDSFADALTFGVCPALLAKILLEHEETVAGVGSNARVHFLASAAFALMAILRLARYNLETDGERKQGQRGFRGLPSPAAAGTVAASIWIYLIFAHPELETSEGVPTPTRRFLQLIDYQPGAWMSVLEWVPLATMTMLPVLGILMVSDVRYPHLSSLFAPHRRSFFMLVATVFAALLLYLAPVPVLFFSFTGFTLAGVLSSLRGRGRDAAPEEAGS